MVEAVKIPVTAKMRLGWDDENLTAPDLARALEDAGVAAIFVHGRTREQGFGGTVNLAGIRAVVQAVKTVPGHWQWRCHHAGGGEDDARPDRLRGGEHRPGAFYNPWIFQHTRHYLETGELLPEPEFEERVRVMCRHLDLMIEVFGEDARLPDVPQGGAVVCEAVRPGQRVQQARRARLQPRGVPDAGILPPLAAAVPG